MYVLLILFLKLFTYGSQLSAFTREKLDPEEMCSLYDG